MHDRLCRLSLDYQDEEAERGIVALRTRDAGAAEGNLRPELIVDAVAVTHATRTHPDLRQGSSVRGAIDIVLIGMQLAVLRGCTRRADERYPPLVLDAMLLALSGRIHLDEAAATTPEAVLHEIWTDHFVLSPATAAPG